jgi:transposase
VAERVRVRDLTNEEGNRLLRIVRRSSGSVVTWRRAQMVLLSAQAMDVAMIAQVTFTSPDRVRDVLHNFNLDGFDSLYPRYAGGRPPTFTLVQRRQIKQAALSRPVDHDLPFSTWSLAKLADFLVAEGVVDDISHEGLRALLREEGVSFQVIKTWKQSSDPAFEAKKNRILVPGHGRGPVTSRACSLPVRAERLAGGRQEVAEGVGFGGCAGVDEDGERRVPVRQRGVGSLGVRRMAWPRMRRVRASPSRCPVSRWTVSASRACSTAWSGRPQASWISARAERACPSRIR